MNRVVLVTPILLMLQWSENKTRSLAYICYCVLTVSNTCRENDDKHTRHANIPHCDNSSVCCEQEMHLVMVNLHEEIVCTHITIKQPLDRC